MSQELITQEQHPFMTQSSQQLPGAANVGSVTIEQQRAIAEAQGQIAIAKRFPRNLSAAFAELMDACKLPALAEVAFYSLPRGKTTVSGPSIRLAEEIARVYGNFEYGHRELSRDDKKSEVEVYAWDKEKNNFSRRQLTVMHVLDTKDGPRKLRDQKDIDDKIANVASKQVRGRILALMPKWLVESAVAECRKTLSGNNDIPISERVRKMTQAFGKFGVTSKHLETVIGHSLDEITPEEIADLQGIFNAIRDGGKISDFFPEEAEVETETAKVLTQAAVEGVQHQQKPATASKPNLRNKKQTAEPQPEPTKEPEPQSEPQVSNVVEENSNTVEAQATENPANSSTADDEPPFDTTDEPVGGEGSDPDDVF